MYVYEIIEQIENRLFEEIKEELLNDKLLLKKIDKSSLIEILDKQKKILKEYINDFQIDKKTFSEIDEFYKNSKIPFEAVYRSLNFIKDKILLFLKNNNYPKQELIEFSDYLVDLINHIAKIYLKKDLYKLKKINDDVFKDKILIRVHNEWINKIILAIEKENIQYYPFINVDDCPFEKYLYYPESLMICLDKRLCSYLDEMHRIIHRLADTLYYHLSTNEWIEAYFVFNDFVSQMKKFTKSISEMYFLAYSNPEKHFFKLVELLSFEKRIYVSMIDFYNYHELIKNFSESVVSKAMEVLEKRISKSGFYYPDSFLIIRGLSAGFYMLNMNIAPSAYKDFVYKIKKTLSQEVEIDGIKLNFKPFIVGAEIDLYKSLKDYEFIDLLVKLEEKAKEEKKEIILLVEEEKTHIDTILDHKYDGQYILKAFDNENIDIAAQPIFDASSNTILGIEILGRVKENNKLIPMEKFYEQLEKMDLVKSLDLIVGIKMSAKGNLIAKVSKTVFINVDFETLLNKDYLQGLKQIQEKYGFEIILEISDIEYDMKYKILLELYKEYNFKFAIDNFEKQCFSLEVFVRLLLSGAVKYVKISKHLFYDELYIKMLEMVKYLERFNVQIIVKYVEDKDLYEKIIKEGFQYVQGFYLKTPRTVEELIIDHKQK